MIETVVLASTLKRSPGEVLVPPRTLAGKVPPVTQVRSTLLASSLQAIRARGDIDRYLELLPRELHDTLLGAVAGSWMPVDVAMAHYAAADALPLSANDQFENGRQVAERIQNSMLGNVARAAKGVGITPWTALEQFQRLWDRLLQGGTGAVYKLGPKEARLECHGVPLVRLPYFRNAWRGMVAGSGALFCSRIFVNEIPAPLRDTTLLMRVAWA